MKKWQKRVLGVLGLSSLALGLAACGGSDSGKAKAEGPTKIIWYQLGQEPKDFDKVMEKVNEKTKKDLNIEVDMRLIADGDFQQKMGVIINSGEDYDITFVNGSDYANFGSKDAFLNLNDHLDKELKDYVEIMNPGFITGGSIDGNLYALPVNNNLATTEYWTFDKELVDKYNIDVENVSTIDTLEPVLDAFAEANEDSTITPLGQTRTSAYVPFDNIMGGNVPLAVPLEGKTDTIVNLYETEELQSYLGKMHDFYKKGYVIKDAATIANNPFTLEQKTWFAQRQTGGSIGSSKSLLEGIKHSELIMKPLGTAYNTTGYARVAMHAISAGSKKQEEALKLLNYVNTNKEVADLLVFGIEGEHYDRNEDGSITMTNTEGYYQGAWALLNTHLVSKTTPITEETEKLDEESKQFQADATDSPIFGFTFDSSMFRTEIASIQSLMDQYVDSLNSGTVNPEEVVPELNEKLKKAGLDDIKAEAQKQYDEWRANK